MIKAFLSVISDLYVKISYVLEYDHIPLVNLVFLDYLNYFSLDREQGLS